MLNSDKRETRGLLPEMIQRGGAKSILLSFMAGAGHLLCGPVASAQAFAIACHRSPSCPHGSGEMMKQDNEQMFDSRLSPLAEQRARGCVWPTSFRRAPPATLWLHDMRSYSIALYSMGIGPPARPPTPLSPAPLIQCQADYIMCSSRPSRIDNFFY
ncbi:hypothetical protein BCR44DRAFT_1291039 [Catenaria anguillulae PL171]|uniref:Uncharacterized protein n=1 Tax=Catenaria anguillulae PL171 TaxID=765915 RepID=A0A1Y2H7U4_9FUNG|nr:hypothetical protein BCR44DRAFT_1291039 [Catenaria anguillulae PL171]